MTKYRCKSGKLSGSNFREIYRNAQLVFKTIKTRTKRRPYIRSAFFKKEKIFFDFFWIHLRQKPFRVRVRRLRFFSCGVELIKQSALKPEMIPDPHDAQAILYRFFGSEGGVDVFCVQIKEDKKTGQKFWMSVFPIK